MKFFKYGSLASLAFALLACAGEAVVETTGTHVNVAAVVEAGAVTPVNGISSSGQPDEEAFRVFADSGYSAVIDMRGPDEDRGMEDEQATVEAMGLDYIAFPIASRDEINFDTAKELDALLQGIEGPVLLHCGSGNRVGAILALRHSLKGASDDEALERGRDGGLTGLEPLVKERLGEQ
jgi:uncharacterized protein (TIGR01244 family)